MIRSRDIAQACQENVVFMVLSGDSIPHFTTMARFVRELKDEIANLFAQVLFLCDAQGLIGREMFAIEFSQAVGSFLKSSFTLPPITYVKSQPQKIARSLFGHLSAQGIDRYLKGPHTEDLRDYFLDPARPMPDYWNIYYWVYPYQTQVSVRDAVLKDLRCEDNAYIWIMKFFPLAFLMVWDNPKGYAYNQFPNLANWRHIAIDDTVDMPVQLSVVPHERWPEAPTEHTFLMYGEGAMGAFTKGKMLV